MLKFMYSILIVISYIYRVRTRTGICPQSCRCVNQQYAIPATYCTQRGLQRVPRAISNATELLGLQENRLTRIERGDFRKLTQLTRLKLDRNALAYLSPKSFKQLHRLKSLNLAHNRLRSLPAKLFENLHQLEELFLNDNQIAKLPRQLFAALPKLKRLYLQNNRLTQLSPSLFDSLPMLTKLNLANNQLHSVSAQLFANTRQLRMLKLERNMISKIELGAFASLTSLKELTLHENELHGVPDLHPQRTLSKFTLYKNHLRCDCKLRWLRRAMRTHQLVMLHMPRCHTPARHEGKLLREVAVEEFKCDGVWNTWTQWSSCDVGCGGGFRFRTHECGGNARSEQTTCEGDKMEKQSCNEFPCSRGVLTRWSAWGACSATCGKGWKVRSRSCINPYTGSEESNCDQTLTETLNCEEGDCPIHGHWSVWNQWSECSKDCGLGMTNRSRTCTNPQPRFGGSSCKGGDIETQNKVCIKALCTPKTQWGEWSEYNACSASCGKGTTTRMRNCLNEYNVTINIINICPGPSRDSVECTSTKAPSCTQDGHWREWGQWSECDSFSCKRRRKRSCHPPKLGGRTCIGSTSESEDCDEKDCTIYNIWNMWGPWAGCSKECGGGTRVRARSCPGDDLARVRCGAVQDARQTEKCNTFSCDQRPVWGPWGSWSECIGGCQGKQVRKHTCSTGHGCKGRDKQRRYCISSRCQNDLQLPTKCVARGNIDNGVERILSVSNGTGLVAKYSCNKYHKLRGMSKTMVCSSGKWTPQVPPYCVPLCGRTSYQQNQRRARLLGGAYAAPHSWPWQVAIEVDIRGEGWKLRCGGSLINERWVLTAGHCLFDKQPKTRVLEPHEFKIFVGVHNVTERYDSRKAKVYNVEYAIPYPRFDHPSLDNDIGLIKLRNKVDIGGTIRPVCLPSSRQKHLARTGQVGTVVGWGVTLRERASELLQELQLPVVSRRECEQAYENSYNITASMFCAGTSYGGFDTCKGDSGGGYVFFDAKRRKWTVQGIVSWGGNQCGERGKYSVYTKVTHFTQWIRKTMRDSVYS